MAEYVPVRLSHLLRHCSVGAVVRGPKNLMVVPDIRTWDERHGTPWEREIRYVEQVRSGLGIDKTLCTPPTAWRRDGTLYGWIPALRFPSWMRCLRCGLMHPRPWKDHRKRDDVRCRGTASGSASDEQEGRCDGRLEQIPWVIVHEKGYLADVPWHDLAHADARGAQQQCRVDWKEPRLKLIDREGRRTVICTRCQAVGDGSPLRWPFPRSAWQQPWVPESPSEAPEELAWLMEINDVRVHTPVSPTALVIPPESRIRRGTVVDRLHGSSEDRRRLDMARNPLARTSALKQIADKLRCTPVDVDDALKKIDEGYPLYGEKPRQDELPEGEYRALTVPILDLKEDEDFVTRHHTHAWKGLGRTLPKGILPARAVAAIDRLVAVNRLKEIMVLKGFRRADGEHMTPPDLTDESDWLPAVELYGEGIFFTLDEAWLQRWEGQPAVRERAGVFERRYDRRRGQRTLQTDVLIDVSPRFLLCHTLAHVLMRRLDAEAGYPAASLKERIYCAVGAQPMAGVLIYVAVADEQGSLGGLMEMAAPLRFLRLLTDAFEAALWCSLDPVCAEQEGHGPDLLNRAACHACALAPETSCAYGNTLLDRTFIMGDGSEIPAFLECAAED